MLARKKENSGVSIISFKRKKNSYNLRNVPEKRSCRQNRHVKKYNHLALTISCGSWTSLTRHASFHKVFANLKKGKNKLAELYCFIEQCLRVGIDFRLSILMVGAGFFDELFRT